MKAASSAGWPVTGRAGEMGQGWRPGQGSSAGRPPRPPHRPVGTAPWGCSRASRALDLSPVRFAQSPLSPSSCPLPPRAGADSGAGSGGQERAAEPPVLQVSRCLACSGGNRQH